MNLQLAFLTLMTTWSVLVTSKSSFITPPPPGPAANYQDNPTHKPGQELEFQWTSDIRSANLILWQEYPTPPGNSGTAYYKLLLENTTARRYSWVVRLSGFSDNVAMGESAIFYLALYDEPCFDERRLNQHIYDEYNHDGYHKFNFSFDLSPNLNFNFNFAFSFHFYFNFILNFIYYVQHTNCGGTDE